MIKPRPRRNEMKWPFGWRWPKPNWPEFPKYQDKGV